LYRFHQQIRFNVEK